MRKNEEGNRIVNKRRGKDPETDTDRSTAEGQGWDRSGSRFTPRWEAAALGARPREEVGGVREEGHRASSVPDTLGLRGFKEPLTQELEIRDLEPESSV